MGNFAFFVLPFLTARGRVHRMTDLVDLAQCRPPAGLLNGEWEKKELDET